METKSCIQFVELTNRQRLTKKRVLYDKEILETRYDLKDALAPFLRENAMDEVVAILKKYGIALRIETPRKEMLGSFRSESNTIRINNNLDKDMFLSVFLHEIAHLLTKTCYRIPPMHGAEFYYCFQELVLHFIRKNIIAQEMFLPTIYHTSEYDFYKSYIGFKFQLRTIFVGRQVKYSDEVIVRGKGRNGLIECTKLSNNEKIKLNQQTEILPVLDFNW